jgi:hypothetical protein
MEFNFKKRGKVGAKGHLYIMDGLTFKVEVMENSLKVFKDSFIPLNSYSKEELEQYRKCCEDSLYNIVWH